MIVRKKCPLPQSFQLTRASYGLTMVFTFTGILAATIPTAVAIVLSAIGGNVFLLRFNALLQRISENRITRSVGF